MSRAKAKRPAAKAAIGKHVEQQRRSLLRASAILRCAALAADNDTPGAVVADCMLAARELVDGVFDALDSVNLNRPTT